MLLVILVVGTIYFVLTSNESRPTTSQSSGNWTDQTYSRPTQGSSSISTESTTSSQSQYVNVSTTSIQSTESNETSSSTASVALGLYVNSTILDAAQAYDSCGGVVGCTDVIYILNLTVANLGSQTYGFNDLNLLLETNTSNTYEYFAMVYAIQSPANRHPHSIQATSLQPGQKITGEEGFEIPTVQSPSRLLYDDPYAGLNLSANIPPVSAWVSEVVTDGSASISPNYLSCDDPGNGQVQSCYTASYSGMNSSVLGSADYFTGEVMAFQVSISLGKGPSPGPAPGTVAVRSSIASFFVKEVTAPQCAGSDPSGCTSWIVDVFLVPQPGLSYFGSPALTVDLPPA